MNSQILSRGSMRVASMLFLLTTCAAIAAAKDINVPADQPTIQKGIDAAVTGDRVLVAPGEYYERIDFFGKTIELIGTGGAAQTVIDGSNAGTVVTLNRNEAGVVRGFTIRHGWSDSFDRGGAMAIGTNASPTIEDNDFVDNVSGCGGAIAIRHGEARILRNRFRGNSGTVWGGALCVLGGLLDGKRTDILDNVFEWNKADAGGAIYTRVWDDPNGSAVVHIERNVIRHNTASDKGAGISIGHGKVFIINNLIHDNRAVWGGGITFTGKKIYDRAEVINNTIANNTGGDFDATLLPGGHVNVANNIFVTPHGDVSLSCLVGRYGTVAFSRNLVYAPGGVTIQRCDVESGGLLVSDPLFLGGGGKHGFWLAPESPAIDAGNNLAVKRNRKDMTGAARIVNGVVDLGAYEFRGN